jgi:predicted DsbA family dithiol-disulfide isomerase
MSDDSMRAAEVALCAADQGKFTEYQDALFTAWLEKDAAAYSVEELIKLAESLGLDKVSLKQCLDSGSKIAELDDNMSMAKTDGMRVLPAVIIDGVKIEGYKPLDTYINLIEQALKDQGF